MGICGPGKAALHYLFESWVTSEENWRKSSVFINVANKESRTRRGVKRWLTIAELTQKFGEATATAIKEYKEANQPEEVRDNPDCPGVEAMHSLGFRV